MSVGDRFTVRYGSNTVGKAKKQGTYNRGSGRGTVVNVTSARHVRYGGQVRYASVADEDADAARLNGKRKWGDGEFWMVNWGPEGRVVV